MIPIVHEIITGILTASVLALAAWIYKTGAKLAAFETMLNALSEVAKDIKEDVREIRNVILKEKHHD